MRNTNQARLSMQRIWILFTLMVIIFTACAPAVPLAGESDAPAKAEKSRPAAQPQSGRALLIEQATTADTFQMVPIDLSTGNPVEGVLPVAVGSEINYAVSPDRTKLAIASKGAGCERACLRVYRLADLEEIARVELPEVRYTTDYVHQIVFDAQSARLAVAYGIEGVNRIAVIDISGDAAEVVQDVRLSIASRLMAFTGDGGQIMVIGHILPENGVTTGNEKPLLQAQLLDANTLENEWQQNLPAVRDGFFGSVNHEKPEDNSYYMSGISADAARQRVYIAHADEAKLTTVDFQARQVTTREVRDPQTLIERILEFALTTGAGTARAKAMNSYMRQSLLSPDGKTLYVVGTQNNMVQKDNEQWEMVYTPLGLEAWDVESGNRLAAVETQASEIRWAVDGKILLNGYNTNTSDYRPFTEVFDPAEGRITARLEDTYAFSTLRVNGEPALVSIYTQDQSKTFASVLDGKALRPALSWRVDHYAFWLEYR